MSKNPNKKRIGSLFGSLFACSVSIFSDIGGHTTSTPYNYSRSLALAFAHI